jgi:endonuclease/exonuclease/phosphatase family metal-dependent hydrolase
MTLKILSWNIWYDCHFAAITKFLAEFDADIIGLQEVAPDDSARDVISYLAKLGYQHVFVPAFQHKRDGRIIGNAIFSKYEITSTAHHILSTVNDRQAVQADIKVGANTLHVFSTHLLHTHQQVSDIQTQQAESLLKVLPADRTIVMGDFNATPDSVIIRKMNEALVNTDPALTPTWSVYAEGCSVCKLSAVNIRLDYIFTSHDLKTASPQVHAPSGSDHLSISVMIEI